jgi:hypothetical protein
MNIYDLLIKRSRQATPPVTEWNSYFPVQAFEGRTVPNPRFVIEHGKLVACKLNIAGGSGYQGQIGTSDQWTCVTESYGGDSGYAYGICDGEVYLLDYINLTATAVNLSATLVAGSSYTHATYGNVYGLACNSNGLYRLDGTTATLINSKGDWTQIGGGVGDPSPPNEISPYALDSTGTVYLIAYDGTLTQIATGMTAISAGYNNYTNWTAGYYGAVDEITYYQPTSGATPKIFYIHNGSLYRISAQANIHDPVIVGGQTGVLVDDTGTWTSVWARGNWRFGVRDNSLCTLGNSDYTDLGLAVPAWKCGFNAYIGRDDGYIYWQGTSPNWGRLTPLD